MRRILLNLIVPVLVFSCLAIGCGDETTQARWPDRRVDDSRDGGASGRAAHPPPVAVPETPADAADALPESALARGRFLIANRRQQSDFFARTVVLLLDYSPAGAFGVIVNRPAGVGLSDLLPALDSVPWRLDRVHLGGPVEPGRMVFLMRSASAPSDSRHVFADIHATSSASELRGAIERDESPERFRAYVGYAGWSPGQLDDEVARGDWHVVPAEPGQVFDPAMGDLWDRLVQDHEGLPIRWRSPTPRFIRVPTWDAL